MSYGAWLNGFTGLAITKLDVLDDLPELKICTGYRLDGETITRVPDTVDLTRVEPVYETWPGWQTSTATRTWEALPERARAYLNRLAELADVPIAYVSVGPERDQLIVM